MARLQNPSEQQLTFFSWAKDGKGSAVLVAVAGSGKTTTIVELAHRIPSYMTCGFLAFNKSVAEELKNRLPQHVKAMTLNAMGHSAWMKHIGWNTKVEVTDKKVRQLMKSHLNPDQFFTHIGAVPKLVALAKSIGIIPYKGDGITPDTDDIWLQLIEHHQLEVKNPVQAIETARTFLKLSNDYAREVIDYDDQLYLPVINNVAFFQNDWLMVDEAQDINKIQRVMLRRALKPTGRLVAVGDPCQAIYGFRGADSESIANIKKEFNAIELPLTVSYRCPQAVVREAHRFVSHITAAPTAPEGSVGRMEKFKAEDFKPTDAILCRNTAPLVMLIFKLLRNKVGARILGREIGAGVINIINQMKASSLEQLESRLEEYRAREVKKLIDKQKEEQADALNDKVDTIIAFIQNLDEGNRSVQSLIYSIESIFQDKGDGLLTLCTVHKAKGLEWPRVFILDADELMPSKFARQPWQQVQERNLQYVAVTRVQYKADIPGSGALFYINSSGFVDARAALATVTPAPPLSEQSQELSTGPLMCGRDYSGVVKEVARKLTANFPKLQDVPAPIDVPSQFCDIDFDLLTAASFQEALEELSSAERQEYSRVVLEGLGLHIVESKNPSINHMRRAMAIKTHLLGDRR